MYTLEQLAPVKAAAIIYCKKIGQRPEADVPAPHPSGLDTPYARPTWAFIGDQMMDLLLMLQAIAEAKLAKEAVMEELAAQQAAEEKGSVLVKP